MKRIFSVLILVAVGAMGPGVASEPAESPPPTDVTELSDSIVVTANRVGISARQSVWPVKVIKEPLLLAGEDIPATLDGRSGLDIRTQSGTGSLSTLSNWGVFARHMLLAYNGRVVKDYSLGGFNLSDFSPAEIDRIEILKGPQSAFYGADAIGGVVNLISPGALTDRADVQIKQGSFGFQQYVVNLSHRFGQIGLAGFAEIAQSDNHRHNSGTERKAFSLRSDYLSSRGVHHLSLSARYFDDSLGVPGPQPDPIFVPAYGDEESWSLYDHQKDENYSVDLQYRLVDSRIGNLQFDAFWEKKNLDYNSFYNYLYPYYIVDNSVDPPDSSFAMDSVDVYGRSIYNKRSAGLSGRYARDFGRLELAGGIDFLSGSVRATTSDLSDATTISGPFAPFEYQFSSYNFWKHSQDQLDFWSNSIVKINGWARLDLSGRLQFVQGRQTQPSYNLGLIFSTSEWWQGKVGYAYAFRLPTIAEQFAEDVFTAGNDELEPETSRTLVGTLALTPPDQKVTSRLSVFHQSVDSLIQYQLDFGTFLYVPENISRFRSTGVDIELEYRLRKELSLSTGAVIQKAEQKLPTGEEYVDAFYVPDVKWRFDIFGAYYPMTYGFNINYTSDRSIILGGETKTIEKVYELGLTLGATITPELSLSLSCYDLTNQARPDQFGFSVSDGDYPSPGFRFVVGLRYGLR